MLLLTGAVIVFFIGFFLRGLLVRDTIIIETEKGPLTTVSLERETQEEPSPAASEPAQEKAIPEETDDRLNLNTASRAELETLPGIGPVLAERIIAAREARGGFQSLGDLLEVEGIGKKTLENLIDLVKVEEAE